MSSVVCAATTVPRYILLGEDSSRIQDRLTCSTWDGLSPMACRHRNAASCKILYRPIRINYNNRLNAKSDYFRMDCLHQSAINHDTFQQLNQTEMCLCGPLSTVSLCTSGLGLAMARDGSSGGVIRMAIITEDGVERSVFTGADIPRFYSD